MAAITEYLEIILDGSDLTFEQAKAVLDATFEGDVADVQIAALLAAIRSKNASVAEIAGFARSLRDHCIRIEAGNNLVDTCGTGGARLKTFNISTTAALVAAGAGARVAKHGNRGITSKCGSADVLAELGVKIDTTADIVTQCIEKANIGFMFAPMFHPAMKYVQPIRRGLEFRTIFNILGPLANPAAASAQVMGVAEEALMQRIAEALQLLGVKRAVVVHSEGLDEISTMGPTKTLELRNGRITAGEINPSDYGIALADFESLKGGDAQTNATITRQIISGKETGPKRDIVVLNAAAALLTAKLADDFESAINKATESITRGKAQQCLEKLIEVSND